jgi:uncharacterized protein YraI
MEKADVLGLSIAIGDELRRRGHTVTYTRETDIVVPLGERSAISNQQPRDLFVSVHRNAVDSPTANGFEVWVANNPSARSVSCANSVLSSVNNLRVFENRGLKNADFAVLRNTTAPAILIEYGFLSNPADNQRFDNNFRALVNATVNGIESCLGGTPMPPQPGEYMAVVTTAGGNLNVRSGPSPSAPVIGSLPNGTRVDILAEQNGWYRISFGGREGWISRDFVSIPQYTGTVRTAGGNLNMRSAPSSTASIIASIPNGTEIPILGITGTWYHTRFNGRPGFVSRDFVRIS